jgi:RND family efflux transporter MFP subunit
MHRKSAIIIITALAAALVYVSCSSEGGGVGSFLSKAFKKGGQGVPVTVQKPKLEEHAVSVAVPGILTPSAREDVKLPGDARIDTFFVNVGDAVKKGTALFQISREDQNLKVAQLRAEQKELQANLEKNTYFFRNRDRLLEEGRITTEQFESLEAEVDKNEEDLERVNNQLTALEAQTEGATVVSSPIAGVVQKTLSSAGGVAVANTPIVTIVSNDPMIVTFRLASYEATNVQKGMPVEVRIADLRDEQFTATMEMIGTELNRDTNTFEVQATLPNPQGIFKAGMNAFIEFSGPETQRYYVIPASALVIDRRRYYLYTVVQGAAHKVRVIPRNIRGGVVEIAEGLHDNDLVVIKGADKLSEGTVVDIW